MAQELPVAAQEEEDAVVEIQYVLAEGQLTDQLGVAVSGVLVTVRPVDRPDGEPLATATTDALGDFVLTASKPYEGKVVLSITKEMYTELTQEIELGGEDVPFIGKSLHGSLTVHGRVVNALTAAPVVGAEVSAASYEESWSGTSDEQGRFTLTGVSPGGGELT
ncbi:MAG: carboxypeptidase-like regulatory domain-containing protein, partial [Limibaculum sp.]